MLAWLTAHPPNALLRRSRRAALITAFSAPFRKANFPWPILSHLVRFIASKFCTQRLKREIGNLKLYQLIKSKVAKIIDKIMASLLKKLQRQRDEAGKPTREELESVNSEEDDQLAD